jgi:hypothetical protein
MPTVPNPLSELGILPLAAKALKEFRARDEVRTLLSLVDSDLRRSDMLPFGAADEVLERLHGLLVQPEIAGALTQWIDTGEKRVREPLELRLAQLLVFDGIDSHQLAALVVRSVETNLPRAKRSDREALLLESRRICGPAWEPLGCEGHEMAGNACQRRPIAVPRLPRLSRRFPSSCAPSVR